MLFSNNAHYDTTIPDDPDEDTLLPSSSGARRRKSSQPQPQQDDYFGCSCSCHHRSLLRHGILRLWLPSQDGAIGILISH